MIFLTLYCLLLILSIFSASWRLSIGALSLQAIGMGIYLISVEGDIQWHQSIGLVELILVKGMALPWFLSHRFERAGVPRFIDLIPANLLHWTVAAFFVAFSYLAASELSIGSFSDIMLVGAVLSAVALGMLALSSQNELPGQLIAVLTIENGMSLFAIDSAQETPWLLELFVVLDFIFLVILASNFLGRVSSINPRVENPIEIPPEQETVPMTSTNYGDVL